MKKYLLSALALPLLFACSSEDYLDQKATDNDQFAGIEKVDATFSMAEGTMRMANDWELEEGDKYGFAWLGDGTNVGIDGNAYQNHPLTQTGNIFKPETSIYVGKYFLYRPYDFSVVSPAAINFTVDNQTVTDGMGGAAWAGLAKNAIIIGDKWTDVTTTGTTDAAGKKWDEAGIEKSYKIYAAIFSNQTGLDLTYTNNNLGFAGQVIAGATDINYTYPTGSTIGAADIYDGTVELVGAAKTFTYAPTAAGMEPITVAGAAAHDGTFWANKKNVATAYGFNFTDAAVTLNFGENGISTDKANNKGWFWFNSLPVTAGNATSATVVNTILNTSYGVVTINETLASCAYAYDDTNEEWVKLAAADNLTADPVEWDPASHNTFVNQYGNHKGKYELTVDFSTANMANMHVRDDAHLQKLLKYYIASNMTSALTLNLDQASATDNTFKISKISIALIQTIQAAGHNVKVQACTTHGTPKIIVTQDGQAALGLADKKEVPALNNVFAVPTDVYLSSDCEWTWTGGTTGATAYKTPLTIDTNVSSITNEGTLTVNATNVELSVPASTLENAAGATMTFTKVTTVKNDLTNLGTINVGSSSNKTAEIRAYGAEIKNDATSLTASGTINNYGVVGVSAGTTGQFNNYGLIDMKDNDAITLLTSNEIYSGANAFGANFSNASGSENKMGTVVLPEGNKYALVSVSNGSAQGFIKYKWNDDEYSHDAGNVKYNTIVVEDNIEFKGAAGSITEIKFIEFNGTRTKVVNPAAQDRFAGLKGIIVNAGKSIIIEMTNQLVCSDGAYLGAGATVYKGGTFTYPAGQETANYFSITGKTWSTDQIVEY